jgi:hypothetical protein
VCVLRLFPKIDRDDLIVRLFYKAVANQWSAEDLDWDAPIGLTPRQAQALTNIITPVYLGEQSAMNGAATVLPSVISAGETAAQLYLSTFLLDEGRHFDALTRLYEHLGNEPVPVRKMPEMLRYHHRLSQGDRIDWLWGILISDLFAREFYLTFSKVQPRALFGQLSTQILRDESRHQAFAHTYLKNAIPQLPDARRLALVDMKDELLEIMEAMNRRLRPDSEALGIDGDAFMKDLIANIEAHAAAIGLGGSGSRGGGGPADRYRDAPDWWRLLEDLRARARASSGGVQWPEPAEPVEADHALAAEAGRPEPVGGVALLWREVLELAKRGLVPTLGTRLGRGGVPELTAADLRLLVGPLPGRGLDDPARPRPARRIFPAAHPVAQALARCASCALALLCRTAVLRGASAARV